MYTVQEARARLQGEEVFERLRAEGIRKSLEEDDGLDHLARFPAQRRWQSCSKVDEDVDRYSGAHVYGARGESPLARRRSVRGRSRRCPKKSRRVARKCRLRAEGIRKSLEEDDGLDHLARFPAQRRWQSCRPCEQMRSSPPPPEPVAEWLAQDGGHPPSGQTGKKFRTIDSIGKWPSACILQVKRREQAPKRDQHSVEPLAAM
jgi:hypothetical protein